MTRDIDVVSKQEAAVVAGKSKSSEKKENSKDNKDVVASESVLESEIRETESTSDDPIVIDGEAVEVDAKDEDFPADENARNSDGSEANSDVEAAEQSSLDETQDATDLEEAPSVSAIPANEAARSGGGASVLALMFGGIVAGAIGYFGATFAPRPETPTFDDADLTAAISANASALAELQSSVGRLQGASPSEVDLSPINGTLDDIGLSLSEFSDELASIKAEIAEATTSLEETAVELSERIVALETAVPAAGELATGDELSALRSRIEEMMAEAETRLAKAQSDAEQLTLEAAEMRAAAEAEALAAAARAEEREAELLAFAERQSALVDLKAAVESGASYSDALQKVGDVPDVISANADTGLPTLKSLQEQFPALARAALAASATVSEDASTGEKLTAFLKRRTNARSLTEQEGDEPDAVLSRAEARLGEGDLAAAISELEALPETGKDAMAVWLGEAQARLTAVAALEELTATN